MDQEIAVPCRGSGEESCTEIIQYKREPLKGMWRALVIYLTCRKGHTNAYELPLPPAAPRKASRGAATKTARKPASTRAKASQRRKRP